MRSTAWIGLTAVLALTACGGGSREEQLRSVKSYEFSSCDSVPTTDPTHLAALNAFRAEVQSRYFSRSGGSLFVANHEDTAVHSGLREYEGPFHIYIHPRAVEPRETEKGIEWIGMAYLHAARVRTRANGGDWSGWERVRTRNFGVSGVTGDGLGRWKCLMNAEVAWAEVSLRSGVWQVTPEAVSVYEAGELSRLQPTPSPAQIEGDQDVPAATAGVSDRTSA